MRDASPYNSNHDYKIILKIFSILSSERTFFMKRVTLSGGFLVFLGAAFWSLNSPLVKYLTLDSFLICGLRSLIAGLVLAVMIRPKQLHWNKWMAIYVVSYTGLCLSIILALNSTSAPVAIGMQYTAAVWLFLVGLLRTRHFQMRAFLPVLVICIGVVFFMCSGADAASQKGNLIALTEGIFFALMTVGAKKVAGTNPIGLTAVANLFAGVAVFLLAPGTLGKMVDMTGLDWVIMLVLGAVQIGAGYACYNIGIQKVSAQKASVIALWEMILGPVWVALFLKEYPQPMVLIGFVIILLGMLMDALLNTESVPSESDKSSRLENQL